MHFASRITLSGIALSGVAIISFRTFADASIRFATSDSSLSADQLTPTNIEQMVSTRRHLCHTVAVSLIVFILFRASLSTLLIVLATINVMPQVSGFYPAEAVNRVKTFLRIQSATGGGLNLGIFLGPYTGSTVWWVPIRPTNLESLLDTTPPKRVPVLWDG